MSQSINADDRLDAFALSHVRGFWVNEIPYFIILALTLGGVAYSSTVRQSLVGYWEFMAVGIGIVCVVAGFHNAHDARARWRLVWTQTLHWGAFLIAMNMVLLPVVRSIANADIVSLALLLLLALGTFIAGVHIASWRMCANGVIMAIGVPAIAWLDQSALFLALVVIGIAGLAAAFFWRRHQVGHGDMVVPGGA
jgi:hypothetical protein